MESSEEIGESILEKRLLWPRFRNNPGLMYAFPSLCAIVTIAMTLRTKFSPGEDIGGRRGLAAVLLRVQAPS